MMTAHQPILVADNQTEEDLELAIARVKAEILDIEAQLADYRSGVVIRGNSRWVRSARTALSHKRILLNTLTVQLKAMRRHRGKQPKSRPKYYYEMLRAQAERDAVKAFVKGFLTPGQMQQMYDAVAAAREIVDSQIAQEQNETET